MTSEPGARLGAKHTHNHGAQHTESAKKSTALPRHNTKGLAKHAGSPANTGGSLQGTVRLALVRPVHMTWIFYCLSVLTIISILLPQVRVRDVFASSPLADPMWPVTFAGENMRAPVGNINNSQLQWGLIRDEAGLSPDRSPFKGKYAPDE